MFLLNRHLELVNEVRIVLRKKKKREKEHRSFELHPIHLTKCPVLWNTDVSCQGNPALTHVGNAVPSRGVTCGNLKDESWPMTTILKVCAFPGKKRTLAVSPYIHIHHGPHSTPTSTKANPQEICRSSGAENNDDNDSSAPTRASAEAMHSVRLLIWDAIQQLYKFTVKVAQKKQLRIQIARWRQNCWPHLEATLAEKLLALPPRQLNNGPGTRYWSQWIL